MASEVLKLATFRGDASSVQALLTVASGHTYTVLSVTICETGNAAETFKLLLGGFENGWVVGGGLFLGWLVVGGGDLVQPRKCRVQRQKCARGLARPYNSSVTRTCPSL